MTSRRPVTATHAFLAAAGAVWSLIVINIAMYGVVGGLPLSPALRMGVSALVAEIGLALPLVLVLWLGHLDLDRALGLARPRVAPLSCALAMVVGGGIVLDELMFLAVSALPSLRSEGLDAMGATMASASGGEAVLLLLPLALAPAVVEEALCRGVILRGLTSRFDRTGTRWLPLAASSLFFGLLHLDLLHASAAATMGLVLGVIAVRTGSLWPAVVCHLFNNAVSILTPVCGGPSLVDVLDRGRSLPTVVSGIVVLCVGLVGLYRTTSRLRSG